MGILRPMEMIADLAAWRAAARRFDGPHGKIAWWEAGEGPSTLLIHGFPTSSWDWSRMWARLAETRRVVAIDMLGFGLSDKPAQHRYSLLDQADLQERIADERKLGEVDIIAHDYGVSVAQELLARQRDGDAMLRLRSVTYLNGGLIPGSHKPRFIQRLLASPIGPIVARAQTRETFGRIFSAIFGPDTKPDRAALDNFWNLLHFESGNLRAPKIIRYMADRVANRARWVGALAANVVPQRYICGAADPISGGPVAKAYLRAVPDADLVLLEGVGHYPHWEDPEGVLDAFFSFQARIGAKKGAADAASVARALAPDLKHSKPPAAAND